MHINTKATAAKLQSQAQVTLENSHQLDLESPSAPEMLLAFAEADTLVPELVVSFELLLAFAESDVLVPDELLASAAPEALLRLEAESVVPAEPLLAFASCKAALVLVVFTFSVWEDSHEGPWLQKAAAEVTQQAQQLGAQGAASNGCGPEDVGVGNGSPACGTSWVR
eukprot:CAMPEP_0194752572 /NCGR_PEP_ID=MMETSP0323_2-20130528/6402_1 /TAXON_ID=2866 ORGANISM="Crypthecodinium cohnii, Strain Seligo" /NCGR_SAMPLE_ID=MMETSP0323_2 /ASSEMBLY_ACC=CAM_ASM_000346 /LENGTH=167 /DNA_ID=CAMNT_0039669625 /DNA_START=211 /DNA_END=715 /DNA_ORIENTATION=-